jgi:hypothetical protein
MIKPTDKDTDQNQTATQTTDTTAEMPLFDFTTLQPRVVKGIRSESLTAEKQLQTAQAAGAILTGTEALQAKGVDIPIAGKMIQRADGMYYLGKGLVDVQGYVARDEYDLETEPETILNNMTADQRKLWALEAKRVGFYGAGDPSATIKANGQSFSNTDLAAMQMFLRAANLQQITFGALFSQLPMMASVQTGGVTVKVTAPEDISYYFRQAWINDFGKPPTKAQVDKAIKSYQQMERSAATSGQQAPSLSVATKAMAAEGGKPGQRGAYSLGKAMERAMNVLSGRS